MGALSCSPAQREETIASFQTRFGNEQKMPRLVALVVSALLLAGGASAGGNSNNAGGHGKGECVADATRRPIATYAVAWLNAMCLPRVT